MPNSEAFTTTGFYTYRRHGPASTIKRVPVQEITIKTISVADAKEKLAENTAVFIDIRDPDSYEAAHIPGAIQLNDSKIDPEDLGDDFDAGLPVAKSAPNPYAYTTRG